MSYRFTNTEKWNDPWFCGLKQIEKLLFLYIIDNCDIAGFIEVNMKKWAFDLSATPKIIEGAAKGLRRGLIFNSNMDCIYIKNFLRHQKNYPLNNSNNAHLGILKRFEIYRNKFGNEIIDLLIEGAAKGLPSPIGIGNDTGIDLGTVKKGSENENFVKPTITEISSYCTERKNNIQPELFFNHYESNGWMVGKTRMKKWKSAIITWEKNDINRTSKQPEKKEEPKLDPRFKIHGL